jgi:hypothetical protein
MFYDLFPSLVNTTYYKLIDSIVLLFANDNKKYWKLILSLNNSKKLSAFAFITESLYYSL